jgi:hypothetical protein
MEILKLKKELSKLKQRFDDFVRTVNSQLGNTSSTLPYKSYVAFLTQVER